MAITAEQAQKELRRRSAVVELERRGAPLVAEQAPFTQDDFAGKSIAEIAQIEQQRESSRVPIPEQLGFEEADVTRKKELAAESKRIATAGRTAFEEAKVSLKKGGLNVVAGLGGTLEELARLADKPILNQLGDVGAEFALSARFDLQDPKLTATSLEGRSPSEKVGLWFAQNVPGTISFMLGNVVATILGGPQAAFAFTFSVEGENAFQGALERGATKEQANIDRLVVGTIVGIIEQSQAQNVLKFGEKGIQSLAKVARDKTFAAIKKAGKEVSLAGLKQFITEGLQEATQEAVSIATPAVREGELPDIDQALKQIGSAGLAGGVSGVFLGGGASGVNVLATSLDSKTQLADLAEQQEDIVKPVEKPIEEPAEVPITEPTQPTEAKKPVAPTDIAPKAVEAKPEAVETKPTKPVEAKKPITKKVKEKIEPPAPEQTTTTKTPEIQTRIAETVEEDFTTATSARQESLAEDRKSLGLDEINSKSRKSWEESLQQAKKEKIASKANRIAEEVNINPRALSDVETAGVTIRLAELKNEHKQAMEDVAKSKDDADIKTLSAEIERIEAEFDALSRAVDTSGTEKGRALAAQKLTINKDFSLISVLNRAKAAAGKKLKAAQQKIFKGLTEKLDIATKKAETLEQEVNELKAKGTLQRGARRFTALKPQQRTKTIADLASDINVLLQQGCNN